MQLSSSSWDLFEPHLKKLNASQRQAVEQTEGAVLVLAGAGTGKTRVLTTRFAYLCASGQCYPSEILAMTFTNKASQEMRERVQGMLPPQYQQDSLWLGTFHHVGLRMLRRYGETLGLPAQFAILDTDDQLRLVKQVLKMLQIDDKKYAPRLILWVIGRFKDRGLLPEDVSLGELRRLKVDPETAQTYLKLYTEYQMALRTVNAVDFGDLILLSIQLLLKNPFLLEKYHRQFKYILVDEYQDINVAQYLWLRLLSQGSGNLCCVGDDDQSIYGWRGAEIDHILRFEKDFPGAHLIRLEENYRSTDPILKVASQVISQNHHRLGKTLRAAHPDAHGEKVRVQGLWDDKEEARFIGGEIEDLVGKGHVLSGMAILVRAGFQTREFEERLILLGIPYRIVGAVRFYERLEIKDALAYLRAVAHPDDSLAFERLLNTPKRGLGPSFLQTLHQTSRERSVSLFRAAEFLAETNQVRGAARLALQGLVKDLCRWSQELSVRPLGEVVAMILDESGYTGFWKKENSPEATGRLENLKELVRVVQEFETLQSFLEHVSLVTEQISAPGEEMLSIMTLHMAKGLEFETVFLAGWEEGLFPSPKTLEEHGEKGLEEERRLAYVGLTRAKKRVTVSFARNRRFYQGWQQASPSRFINEFPQEHIEANLGAGAQNSHFRKNWSSSKDFSNASFMEIEGDVFQGNDDVDSFKKGDVVFHQTFGRGVVRSSAGAHLEIAFGTDVKKIISRFISRQV